MSARASSPVIQVSGICKAYGATVAVADVSFEVIDGEIFGLIGPNGAGKTTTMECIEGLRKPDAGSISVLGLDPIRDVYQLQNRIGVQLQQAQLQKRIKVQEAVRLWASLYGKPASDGDRLLEQLGLGEKRHAWFMTLSGGQKQRLFVGPPADLRGLAARGHLEGRGLAGACRRRGRARRRLPRVPRGVVARVPLGITCSY